MVRKALFDTSYNTPYGRNVADDFYSRSFPRTPNSTVITRRTCNEDEECWRLRTSTRLSLTCRGICENTNASVHCEKGFKKATLPPLDPKRQDCLMVQAELVLTRSPARSCLLVGGRSHITPFLAGGERPGADGLPNSR